MKQEMDNYLIYSWWNPGSCSGHFNFFSDLMSLLPPYLKHPQTSCPGDPCQDDIFIQQNYPSATLSHTDVLPDSLMKVGAQGMK